MLIRTERYMFRYLRAFADRHRIQAGDRLAMFLGLDSIKIIPHEKT